MCKPGCDEAEIDLVFVLDASTSVTAPNFELMKDFVKDFLFIADIDNGNVRVGIIIYSTEDYVQFQLNTYSSKVEIFDAIDNIPYRYGSTNTADALNTMRTEMFTRANGDRPNVPNICIVVTDGVSNINSRRTIPEAEQARAEGIHIYAIGIGLTDTTELDGIASQPASENSFAVQEFSELRTLRDQVFSAFCPGKMLVHWKQTWTKKETGQKDVVCLLLLVFSWQNPEFGQHWVRRLHVEPFPHTCSYCCACVLPTTLAAALWLQGFQ